jgi:hypothetical protein
LASAAAPGEEHRPHVWQGAELGCGAGEPGSTVDQHVNVARHVQGERDPLFDEQHGGAARGQPGDNLAEYPARHSRREVGGGFVEHQHGGLRHEGAGDRKQLPFAAAERLREPLAQLRERREAVEDVREPLRCHVCRQPVPAHLQVLRHGQ